MFPVRVGSDTSLCPHSDSSPSSPFSWHLFLSWQSSIAHGPHPRSGELCYCFVKAVLFHSWTLNWTSVAKRSFRNWGEQIVEINPETIATTLSQSWPFSPNHRKAEKWQAIRPPHPQSVNPLLHTFVLWSLPRKIPNHSLLGESLSLQDSLLQQL